MGVGQPGRLALEFTREAKSAQAAVGSALADVKRVIPTARLIEAAPDFVGLTVSTWLRKPVVCPPRRYVT